MQPHSQAAEEQQPSLRRLYGGGWGAYVWAYVNSNLKEAPDAWTTPLHAKLTAQAPDRSAYTIAMPSGRTLAFDVGDRRIGLAITDPLNLIAVPLFTLHRTTLRADLKSIARFIRKHEVTTLVVGNPLHADGSLSPQSLKIAEFAQVLFADHPTLAHHTLDERLTTREAHTLLDGRGTRHSAAGRIARKDHIDQVAATLLLQAFLEAANGPSLLPDPDA